MHRSVTICGELMSRTGTYRGLLTHIEGGRVEFSAGTRLRGQGNMRLRDTGINWLTDRIKLTYEMADGESIPLGVWLPTAPTVTRTGNGESLEVDLLTPLVVLDEDCVSRPYSVGEGTIVTSAVTALITSTGETRVQATHSQARTSSTLTWDAGTPKLTIINELLQSINYWALFVDGLGFFRVEPYYPPAARSPVREFTDGETSIRLPEMRREQDVTGVPNKVVLVGQAEGDKPALTSEATNTSDDSPFSYQSRGRWVTYVETGVEATDQQVLDQLARRKLIERSTPSATIEITHLPVPLAPNDVVELNYDGTLRRAVVTKWALDLKPTALTATTLREVVKL